MMPACLQTQDCPDILFPLVGTLSVCMEILPTLKGSPANTLLYSCTKSSHARISQINE